MNREKIRKAEKATDIITEAFLAGQKLRTCWVNGFGVLSDPSMASRDLWEAKDAIDKAVKALTETAWPTPADYGEA